MKKRIAIGQILMESDTFSPITAKIEDFHLLSGKKILKYFTGVDNEVGAFINVLTKNKVGIIPTIYAKAQSSGKLEKDAFNYIKKSFFNKIKKTGKLDGILICFHGSMVAENAEDAEGIILQELRNIVGEKVIIAGTLDLHANVTRKRAKYADILVGYDTYPHIDEYETGEKASKLLLAAINRKIKPTMILEKVPMIVPPENMQTIGKGPMADLMRQAKKAEKKKGILSISLFGMQPWLDVEEVGFSVLVITDNDEKLAKQESAKLAETAWKKKKEFIPKLLTPKKAIEKVLKRKNGPVIFADSADGTGSGAPGDSTAVLKPLIEIKVTAPTVLTVRDPEAVEQAIQAGVGNTVKLKIGGKFDTTRFKPVTVIGKVKLISDGIFTPKGPAGDGKPMSSGRTVVINVHNINIVIIEKPIGEFDPQLFRSLGIEPADMKIVVVKSPNLFRAAYDEIAKEIIWLDAPGCASPNLFSFTWKHIKRPVWPFDKFNWKPGGAK